MSEINKLKDRIKELEDARRDYKARNAEKGNCASTVYWKTRIFVDRSLEINTLKPPSPVSKNMAEKGKFIVFEGLDGAGLSTHSALLKKWLLQNNYRVHLSAEPTDSPIGSLIRSILKNYWQIPKRPDILALLYAADRLYHVNYESYGQRASDQGGLRNALHEGYIVIYNRYILSSFAYQSVPSSGVEVDVEWLKKINNFHITNGTRIPDMTIFLDVPPEECIKRITFERERYELFETYPNLKIVYENFKRLTQEQSFHTVEIRGMENGQARSIETVQDEIRKKVMNLLEETPERKHAKPKITTEHLAKVDNFVTNDVT